MKLPIINADQLGSDLNTASGWRSRREHIRDDAHPCGRTVSRRPVFGRDSLHPPLKTMTQWREHGRKVLEEQKDEPITMIHIYKHGHYGLYAESQTVALRKVRKPSEDELVNEANRLHRDDILLALFTLNRRAKRCRDIASRSYAKRRHGAAQNAKDEKEEIYELKGQALHYLTEQGKLKHAGYHHFGNGLYAEVLEGGDYRFHRPCEPPATSDDGRSIVSLGDIDAKPKGRKEPRLDVARLAIKAFLADKDSIDLYDWPPRERPARCHNGVEA